MSQVKRLVLDVLKPHNPNVLEFANAVAALGEYRVHISVVEVDEKTESVVMNITGGDIDFTAIVAIIETMGASLHSIDEVEVQGTVVASDDD